MIETTETDSRNFFSSGRFLRLFHRQKGIATATSSKKLNRAVTKLPPCIGHESEMNFLTRVQSPVVSRVTKPVPWGVDHKRDMTLPTRVQSFVLRRSHFNASW